MGDHLVGCSSYTTPEFSAWNSIGMLRPRSIKSLTLEGILKLLCKQCFRRLTSGHNYVFLRLLLSIQSLQYYQFCGKILGPKKVVRNKNCCCFTANVPMRVVSWCWFCELRRHAKLQTCSPLPSGRFWWGLFFLFLLFLFLWQGENKVNF